MHVRVEPGRVGAFKLVEKRLLISAVADVFTDVIGVFKRQHHHLMSAPVTEGARAGGLSLFMLGFTVTYGRYRFARILAHPFPYVHHVTARGIAKLAAPVLDWMLER